MIQYTNTQKTSATFNGASFSLAAPEDFTSIGDGPTREAVLKWLAAGNVPTLLPPITLATRQTSAWQAIKAKREQVQHGGVLVATKWFHTDESSRALYNTLLATAVEKALLGTDVIAANWKTMDGTFVPMTVYLLRQIRDAGMTAVTTNFANAETHRIAMLASATPETYNFSTGWAVAYPV